MRSLRQWKRDNKVKSGNSKLSTVSAFTSAGAAPAAAAAAAAAPTNPAIAVAAAADADDGEAVAMPEGLNKMEQMKVRLPPTT